MLRESESSSALCNLLGTYLVGSTVRGLLSNNVQQVRGGIQNMVGTEGLELFASQVAGEHTDAGDASCLGGTDVGLGVIRVDDSRLVGDAELLHNSQDLVGLRAAVLDFVTCDDGVDDSVVPAHGGDNDVDDFARKARRQALLDVLVVQCLQHFFDARQRGRRVFLVGASKLGAEELLRVVVDFWGRLDTAFTEQIADCPELLGTHVVLESLVGVAGTFAFGGFAEDTVDFVTVVDSGASHVEDSELVSHGDFPFQ